MKSVGILILLLLVFAGVAGAQGTVMNWDVNGANREALVFSPTSETEKKHPLVFAFHGHGGRMRGTAMLMHLQTVWPEAIIVYPQGLNTASHVDPQGLRPGWQSEAGEDGDRDLKFFDAMLSDLEKKYSVDKDRVYATGFSNGAIFSYLLWAERPNVLAAFGICAGRISDSEQLSKARPVVIVAGESDPILPFALQKQAIESARQVDKATGNGTSCGTGCTEYPSSQNTPVRTYIHPGGHVYPPWAPAAIVDFFKNHKKP
ncbi:MAG TPA: hypothetical protein VEV84_11920 [Pyrinomonadaceae bacterium]|nr:hypothetical protein [Pyrinomonadaceae bacterium]